MKIKQWLGYNEDASQYLLRPGELRILNNLQSRRPGMLITRQGLNKIYGRYDNEGIYGIYRRATILGNDSDFLWLQKVRVPRDLTEEQLQALEPPFEYKWMIRRVVGNASRVIDTLDIQPEGALAPITGFAVAEDRHARMFLFYGHGIPPRLYRQDDIGNVAIPMGLDAPLAAPSVTPSGKGYFIEAVDVKSGGGSYYEPPELTLLGGDPDRPARLKAIVERGNVVGVEVADGGSNYKSPPRIRASVDSIGTGFRGRGNMSNAHRQITGFNEIKAGAIAGAAPVAGETYGTTNGTDGNSILYLSQAVARSASLVSASGATLTLNSVLGIEAGDVVTSYPAASPFTGQTPVTVASVSESANTVTISNAGFSPLAGVAYELSFRRPAEIAQAPAEYDPERRRFYATIPLSSSSSGQGAHAALEFSPTPLGHALNQGDNSSITVINNNWQTYTNAAGQVVPFLYDEYWGGSDYDKPRSAANRVYGGIQAGGGLGRVLGYTGAVAGRSADVYWPNYQKLSVWFNTGVPSGAIGQWQRVDVPVETETDPNTGVTAKVLRFRLRPSRAAKTIKSLAGGSIETEYADYNELPDAIPPEVKIYLRECPESWITNGGQSLPFSVKEEQTNRLAWFSPATAMARPIVDIRPSSTSAIDADLVTITDPGAGWAKDTQFSFRLYQASAYSEEYDYNTAVSDTFRPGGHARQDGKFVQFTFTANAPDALTPHGPPNTLITPAQVAIAGEGYSSGENGAVTLYKRSVDAGIDAVSPAQTITWQTETLSTMSSESAGHIVSVLINSKGRNYFAPPTIEVRGGGNGYGLSLLPVVENGRIESVQILDPGVGYTEAPDLYTSARAAQATAVMRPSMRGTYRCAYRFADRSDTVVGTRTATLGESATTLTLSSTEGVEPDMVLEAPELPFNSKIKSVLGGNQVEINQEIKGLAPDTEITVTLRDMTKPIAYSDLSPIKDVDAGPNAERPHSSLMEWSLPGVSPPERADMVELWRTSADQSLVFYRLEAYGVPNDDGIEIVGEDTLTDEELFNPDRPNYAAMPIVLPNGNVNAYRFGKPRDDMAVGVAFQDRLWMGVSTSGDDPNTLFYSEFDEFESLPDVNELPIQNNQKNTDVLTALVPFGSMLLAMQHTHTYAVAYNTDPAVDATIQMMSHRGCLHQRCWDLHENILYSADESGIYSMSRNGEVQDISLPIRDYFVSELIDFSKRETFFLQADPRTHILRFFCCLKSNPTDTPSVALCFDIQAKSWWTESYPTSLTSACTGRPDSARISTALLGDVQGHLYEINADSDQANSSLTDTFVLAGGSGYREPPPITVPGNTGAIVQGVVSEGRLVDVVIQSPGWDSAWGIGLLTQDDKRLAGHDGNPVLGMEYDAIELEIGPPEPGGVQAEACANWAVTPRLRRLSTVSEGESRVYLLPRNLADIEPEAEQLLTAEDGSTLVDEATQVPIECDPPQVEVGMEAIGAFLPLNSFVSRLDGPWVYLVHPDGEPISVRHGAPRPAQQWVFVGSGLSPWINTDPKNGGTDMEVVFRKPFRTHVPFRMATGSMQLANEDNVKNGDSLVDRSVTLVYTPTPSTKEVEIIERFDGQETMRPNIFRRNRGGPGSFRHRQDSASTVLDVSRDASHLGFSTGVAKAKFASRSNADMTGTDQHLQIEVYGRPEQASPWQRTNFWNPDDSINTPHQFVLHNMTVNGVVENAE